MSEIAKLFLNSSTRKYNGVAPVILHSSGSHILSCISSRPIAPEILKPPVRPMVDENPAAGKQACKEGLVLTRVTALTH
jgi:hypothetical protein